MHFLLHEGRLAACRARSNGQWHTTSCSWGNGCLCSCEGTHFAAHAEGLPSGPPLAETCNAGPTKVSLCGSSENTEQVLCGGVTYRKAVARSTAELYQVRQPQYCAATPCSCPACRCSPCRKLCRAPAPFQSSATQGQPLAKPAACFRLCSRKEKDLSFLPALRCLLLNFTLLCRTSVSPVLCQMV